MVVGLIGIWQGSQLTFFDTSPGPGFVPVTFSMILVGLGLLLTVRRLIPRDTAVATRENIWPTREQGIRVLSAIVATIVGTFLLPIAGFVVAMIAMVAILLLLVEKMLNGRAVLTSVAIPVLTYLIFVVALDVRLP